MPNPVDIERALDALTSEWGDHYEIWFHDGQWSAKVEGTSDADRFCGETPDELTTAIRADWARRNPDLP
jgi:hypothetical protein